MTAAQAVRARLAVQRLSSDGLARGVDVVRLLTCVQAQEHPHALWSLGLRTSARSYAALQAEFDTGGFVRTHILRPTWHLVAPEDLRWLLRLTTPRVESRYRGMAAKQGLTEEILTRADELLRQALSLAPFLARPDVVRLMAQAGLPSTGIPLAHLLIMLEMRGLLVSGPMVGAQHSHRLLEEVIPSDPEHDGMARDAALGLLATRFFAGHGPASVKDLCRWATLTQVDVKRGIDVAGDALESVDVDGTPHWFDPGLMTMSDEGPAEESVRTARADAAYLLPTYDEVTLTYPGVHFPTSPGHPHGQVPLVAADPFAGTVVVDQVYVGTWKRRLTGRDLVEVDLLLDPDLDAGFLARVDAAASRLATFLDRRLVLRHRSSL